MAGVLGTLVQLWTLLVVLLVFLWIVNCRKGFGNEAADYPFNFHPMFMVLAFLFFETQGTTMHILLMMRRMEADD